MKDISVVKLLQLAWKHISAIVLAAVIFACSAFAYAAYVVVPTYSTTATIIFTNGGIVNDNQGLDSQYGTTQREYVSGSDISASDSLGQTVVEILKTPGIYKELAKELGGNYTYTGLSGGFSIQRKSEETLLIDIKYTSTDGDEAVKISNKFADISCDYISDYIPYAKVKVVAEAISFQQVSVGAVKLAIICGLAGALLAYGVYFLLDLSDNSIRGEEDYNANYTAPLLGVVPDFEETKAAYKYKRYGYGKYGYSKYGYSKYGNYY